MDWFSNQPSWLQYILAFLAVTGMALTAFLLVMWIAPEVRTGEGLPSLLKGGGLPSLLDKNVSSFDLPSLIVRVKSKPQYTYTFLDHLCYEIYKYDLNQSSFGDWTCYPDKILDYDCLCIAPMED